MRRLLLLLILFAVATPATADEMPVKAAAVKGLADAAAHAWADDAQLVYVENDEPVVGAGTSPRWGFLYWSASRDEARAYSMFSGKVERAEELGFDFAPPPLPSTWIDSDEALRRADDAGGRDYREDHGATLRSMLLVRGVMHLDEPEKATWTCVYDAAGQPSLWVVLDAQSGKVMRRWKG